jgi:hypothetical protein
VIKTKVSLPLHRLTNVSAILPQYLVINLPILQLTFESAYEYFTCSWRLDSYKYLYCDGRLVFADCSLLWLIYSEAPHTIRAEALKYGSLVKCTIAIDWGIFPFIRLLFCAL